MSQRWTQRRMAELAAEERLGLGLDVMQPLDPYELAARYGVPVYAISELEPSGCPVETVAHFLVTRKEAWSAALIPVGSSRIIIENDGHELVRRRSSVAHEMSHHPLEHEFAEALLDGDHTRAYSEKAEKEAPFLSGELLVPAKACRMLAFKDADNQAVAARFDVSTQFAQMRMRGVRVYADRARMRQGLTHRARTLPSLLTGAQLAHDADRLIGQAAAAPREAPGSRSTGRCPLLEANARSGQVRRRRSARRLTAIRCRVRLRRKG